MRIASICLIALCTVTMPLANLSQAAQSDSRRKGTPPQHRQVSGENGQQAGSSLSETQQQNLQKLQTDLMSLQEGSQVTQAQKDSLKDALAAIADGATRPDQNLVQQLANDLTDALTDQNLSTMEKIQLANDLQQVMNSANIPMEEVEQAIADAQAILAASGIREKDVQTIVADLKAIATGAQKNVQNPADKAKSQSQGRQRPLGRNR